MEKLNGEQLVLRADADTQIGAGHLMRCLALAQAWEDAGGEVTFITVCQGEGMLQRLRDEEFNIKILANSYPDKTDWNTTRGILAGHPGAWMVLDGYNFDDDYQRRVKEAGHRLLVIDDTAPLKHYYADIILNQNLHAEQLRYVCEPYTRLLLGTRYVLLRREFLAWKEWHRDIPEVARRVLVTLGGGDPENNTLKVTHALQEVDIPGLEATAVIGASNPHASFLEQAAKQSRIPIRLMRDVKNMPELMAWADVAVSGGGTTAWELLFLETPALFLMAAENQRYVAECIEDQGLGKKLGQAENVSTALLTRTITSLLKDSNLRATISRKARQIVDGQGAQRVISSMQKPSTGELKLRPATFDDCRLLWEWANDPVVRACSFDTASISWDEHVNWFRQRLDSPRSLLYIIINDRGVPIGQVRFDLDSAGNAEVGISIAAAERTQGYGGTALRLACQRVARESGIGKVLAHIKEDNSASIGAFSEAGFIDCGVCVFKQRRAIEMVWQQK